jgi:zinc protease
VTATCLTLTALGALLVAPGALGAQGYPTSPPVAGAVRPMPFPPFQEARLTNGVRMVLVESQKQPVVSLSLSFPAGDAHDPEGREGLASMVAGLLTKGAGNRTSEQVSATIEGVGGTLGASTGSDFLTISAYVLAPQAALAFELLADAVIRPTFAATEVDLLRTQTLSGLQLEQTQPAALASRFMASELYGQHPYARRPSPESTRAITRDEIASWQRAMLRPEGALLVIAGALTLPEARRLAEASFAGWTGSAPVAAAFPAPPNRPASQILLVHRPSSVQANLVVGNTTFPPTHPQQYAARIANHVLGGGSDSRLFAILREQKSWTYGAYSGLNRYRGIGSFTATAEVRNEVADSALREMLHQLERVTTEPIPADELEAAKGALVGRFPLTVETVQQVANQVSNAILLGLPQDYLSTYRTRLAAVSAAQAQEGARAAIRPTQAAIVVVGDAKVLLAGLETIAPVRVIGVDGAVVPKEQLTAPTATAGPDLNLAAITATRDSFAVMFQGQSVGFTISEVSRTAEGIRIVEETSIPLGGVQQRTEVALDPAGELRSVNQAGQMAGNATSITITVTNGRATGRAVSPQPPAGALDTVDVDVALPTGTLDDNTLTAMSPALAWAPGATFDLNVLSAGSGTIKTVTLTVTGAEQVTLPSGAVEAFRVEMAGGDAPVTLFVTTAAPHHVVKVAPAGAPIEIVLVRRAP